MRKISLITLGILLVLFSIGLFYYYKMGGFEKPVITIVDAPAYVVVGKAYIGDAQGVGKFANETDKLIEQKKINGVSCDVYYSHPDSAKLNAFVGAILKDTTQALPEGYTKKYIPARKIIRAYIRDWRVAPRIYPDINEFADSAKLQLSYKEYLEIYQQNKESYIEVPVR